MDLRGAEDSSHIFRSTESELEIESSIHAALACVIVGLFVQKAAPRKLEVVCEKERERESS